MVQCFLLKACKDGFTSAFILLINVLYAAIYQMCLMLLLEGHSPEEFSSNPIKHTRTS